jgi:hypothetical protein
MSKKNDTNLLPMTCGPGTQIHRKTYIGNVPWDNGGGLQVDVNTACFKGPLFLSSITQLAQTC